MIPFSLYKTIIDTLHVVFFCVNENKHILILTRIYLIRILIYI